MTQTQKAPPDRPLIRFSQQLADLRRGAGAQDLGQLRAGAIAHTAAMHPQSEAPTTPATGSNPWVQLGPVAIPNGQSFGGQARVRVTGRVTTIQVDPSDSQTIYIGTARGGVWKTTDGGETWRPKSDHKESLAIGALAIAPSDSSVLYAGTGEGNVHYLNLTEPLESIRDSYYGSGVLASTNSGEDWNLQGADKFTSAGFYRLAVHPTNAKFVWAATSKGLFRTTNGGATWDLVQGLPAISQTVIAACDIVVDPQTPASVYVAFHGDCIYHSSNGEDATPAWSQLPFDTTGGVVNRIALAISASAPSSVYALVGISSYPVTNAWFYILQDAKFVQMQNLTLDPGGADTYCLALNVDPRTPDIAYLSRTTLLRLVVPTLAPTDIGQNIHADHHALAFDPSDPLTIYAGTDGGIYKSQDGGNTWTDWLNAGMCITQFEFIDQHPDSDALILGGTQDNGTDQFRNSSAFYHSDEGDGGCVAIDPHDPRNMIHTYYGANLVRSEFAGAFNSWNPISGSLLEAPSLFYPPFALNETSPRQIAFGADQLYMDGAQGTQAWPISVTLPQMAPGELVSAVLYLNDDLIVAATTSGQVFLVKQKASQWSATPIHAASLPGNWIWEIATAQGDPNTLFVAMSGFGAPHVWMGAVKTDASGNASAAWSSISGAGANQLPDSPVNTLIIDPKNPKTIFLGTENGVFRSTDWTKGAQIVWENFSDGLPNTAVYDLKIHAPSRLLRAGLHGRGVWERQLDGDAMPDSSIYLRAHRMDSGRGQIQIAPAQAAFDDPCDDVSLGDELWPWETPDLKVDSLEGAMPAYQLDEVDDIAFETALLHRNLQPGRINRLYVQMHNRGRTEADGILVRVYYTDPGPYLPSLPSDFWTNFPNMPAGSAWGSFGDARKLPVVLTTEPAVAEWMPLMPEDDPGDHCFLIIADGEKIPPENRLLDPYALAQRERRAALKNIFLFEASGNPTWYGMTLSASSAKKEEIEIRSAACPGWAVGILLPKSQTSSLKLSGFRPAQPAEFEWAWFRGKDMDTVNYDPSSMQVVESESAAIGLPSLDATIPMILALVPTIRWGSGRITLVRKVNGAAVGGNTVIIRPNY